jgi:hypothetical protein
MRVQNAAKSLNKLTPTELLTTAAETLAGKEVADNPQLKALSHSLGSAIEGGVFAATMSLMASNIGMLFKPIMGCDVKEQITLCTDNFSALLLLLFYFSS